MLGQLGRLRVDDAFLDLAEDIRVAAVVNRDTNDVSAGKLAPRSVVKYHALLHKICARALIDRVVPTNPCTHTELPKVVAAPKRIITVEQFEAILTTTGRPPLSSSRSAPVTSTSPPAS
jgi:hypothetical protein